MSKNVVILSGSPRQGANTDILTAAFAEGAESAGNAVAVFRTADLRIGGCRGCEYCFTHKGLCAQKDDMTPILELLYRADALVFASPVYHANVSAQLKLAIDRLFISVSKPLPVKRAALLLTCYQKTAEEGGAAGAVDMYKGFAAYKGWENAGIVVAPGLDGKHDIKGRPELEQARRLGYDI